MKHPTRLCRATCSIGFLLCITVLNTRAQTQQIALKQGAATDPANAPKVRIIEINKIGSNKTFIFEPGKVVWVEALNKKGKTRITKAMISNIGDHDITFTPVSRNFGQINYTETEIRYIGFTTPARVILATTATILLFPICLIVSAVAQEPAFVIISPRKHINFYNSWNGEKKWNLTIKESAPKIASEKQ